MNQSKHSTTLLALFLIVINLINCSYKDELTVNYKNPNIKYSGRIDTIAANGASLYWSGNSIKINFEGESISALMKDETGDNYYNVIIDNDSIKLFRPDTVKKYYDLASNLSKGQHTIEIFKRTEWNRGKSTFFGFKINHKAKLLPKPKTSKRKLEFYGNSLTAGYAVEDTSGNDSPDSTFTNNYVTFAALTARRYKAEYSCICKSGIGIMVSWFPIIMPEMYDRLNPTDSTSKWDFSNYTPDIIVINLFQNDTWLVNMPNHAEFKHRFGKEKPSEEFIINSYQNFISSIRNHYPAADIICALGSGDGTKKGSKWPEYITKAVNRINDNNIHTLFFPYKNTPGHPNLKEQEDMSKQLIHFIDKNIQW